MRATPAPIVKYVNLRKRQHMPALKSKDCYNESLNKWLKAREELKKLKSKRSQLKEWMHQFCRFYCGFCRAFGNKRYRNASHLSPDRFKFCEACPLYPRTCCRITHPPSKPPVSTFWKLNQAANWLNYTLVLILTNRMIKVIKSHRAKFS